MPENAEAYGLLALILFCESRRAARRSSSGAFVPLDTQDFSLWSEPMIAEAERALRTASALTAPGRFQLEAAIQSVHAQRLFGAPVRWDAVAMFYGSLVAIAPTVGAYVGMAAALGEARGPDIGLTVLNGLHDTDIADYQPYWAVRGHLLAHAGRASEARVAYSRAIHLSDDVAVRTFLLAQAASVS
jgi:predicted RNA polymerase sigma factor